MPTLDEVLSIPDLAPDEQQEAIAIWREGEAANLRTQLPDPDEYNEGLSILDETIQNRLTAKQDTGQGIISSALSSAGKGFGQVFTGTVEGLGQFGGLLNRNLNPVQISSDLVKEQMGETSATRFADAASQFLPSAVESLGRAGTEKIESALPVNPIYAENPIVKGSGVLGQAGGQLASALIPGGLAAKVGQGAKLVQGVALGQGALLGLNAGYQEADRLGITDPKKRDAMASMYAAAEAGTESLGGLGTLAFGKRILEGAAEKGLTRFAKTVGSEAVEEPIAGRLQDVAANLFADEDPNNPGFALNGQKIPSIDPTEKEMWLNSLEEGAYGALGGTVFGGFEALASRGKPPAQRVNDALNAAPAPVSPRVAELEQVAQVNEAALSPAVAALVRQNAQAEAAVPEPSIEQEIRQAAQEFQQPIETQGNEEVVQRSQAEAEQTVAIQDDNAILQSGAGEGLAGDVRQTGEAQSSTTTEADLLANRGEVLDVDTWFDSQPDDVRGQINDEVFESADSPDVIALVEAGDEDAADALMDQKREQIIRNRMAQAQQPTQTVTDATQRTGTQEIDTQQVVAESPSDTSIQTQVENEPESTQAISGVDVQPEASTGTVQPDTTATEGVLGAISESDPTEISSEGGISSQSATPVAPTFDSALRSEIATLNPVAQSKWGDEVIQEAIRWSQNPSSDTTLTTPQKNLVGRVQNAVRTPEQIAQQDQEDRAALSRLSRQERADRQFDQSTTDPVRAKQIQDDIDALEAENRVDDNEPDTIRFSRNSQPRRKIITPEHVEAAINRFKSTEIGSRMLDNLLFAANPREALNLPEFKNRKFSRRSLRSILDANGFFDPQTSKSVVMLDEIVPLRSETPEDAVFRVALHEQFHGGLQWMMAKDSRFRNKVIRIASQLQKQGWGEIADRYPELLDDPMAMFQEWMIARLERGDPVELAKTDPLWKQFWDALKDLVRRIVGSDIPEADLDRMARSLAAKMLNEPEAFTGLPDDGGDVSTSEEPSLSKRVQLEESDFQRYQTPEEKEAAAQAIAEANNISREDVRFIQRMGMEEVGAADKTDKVAPMVAAVKSIMGQKPRLKDEMRVSEDATKKAWELAAIYDSPQAKADLIAYVSQWIEDVTGTPHGASGAVEVANQMLMGYAKLLGHENKDYSLLQKVQSNYDTATEAARVLATRSALKKKDPMMETLSLVEKVKEEVISSTVTSKDNQQKLKTKAKGTKEALDETLKEDSKVEEADNELEEAEATPETKTALDIIDRIDKSHTEWVAPEPNRNRVQELKKEALTSELTDVSRPGHLTQEQFIERYAKGFSDLGVDPKVATNLAQRLYGENRELRTNKESRARDRKAKKISVKGIAQDILNTPGYALHDPAQTAERIQNYLTKAGFSQQEASRFASKYAPLIREKILQARELAFQQAVDSLTAKGITEASIKKIREALRAGVLDPADAVAKGLAEQSGFKDVTPEQYAKMLALDAKMDKAGWMEGAMYHKEMADLVSKNMPDLTWKQRLGRSYTNSILSGIGTMGIQFTTPVFSGLARLGTETATILGDAATGKLNRADVPAQLSQTLQNMVESVKGFGNDFLSTYKNGVVSLSTEHTKLDEANLREDLDRSIKMMKSGDPATKLKGLSRFLFASTDVTHRVMLAADEAMTRAMQRFFVRQGVLRIGGLKDSGLTTDQARLIIAQANNHAHEKAQEAARNGRDPREAEAIGRAEAVTFITQAVEDLIGPEKAAELKEQAIREARMEIGTRAQEEGASWDVFNLISQVMVNASNFAREKDPILGRMITGFVTVPVNLANRSLNFTPYGLARAYAKTREKAAGTESKLYNETMGSDLQLRQRYVEGVAGTVGLLVAAALAGLDDDEEYDKKTGFRFTGYGPEDQALRDAWLKAGNRPYSIEYLDKGKVKAAISYARGGPEIIKLPAAAIGALDDMRLNGQLENKDVVENTGTWMKASLGAGLKATNFFGLKNLANVAGMGDKSERSAVGSLAWMGSGLIPWSGFTKSVTRLGQGPIDQSSVRASIIANIPLVSLAGEPALNFLGDEKGFQPFSLFSKASDKANYTGFPVYISKDSRGINQPLYEFMLKSGATPSMPLRSALESKNGMLTDRRWAQYIKTRGQFIKESMYSRLSELQRMSADEQDKAISSISSAATTAAKKKMSLE